MSAAERSALRWSRRCVNRVLMLGLMSLDLLLLNQRTSGSKVQLSFLQLYHRFLLDPALRELELAFNISFVNLCISVIMWPVVWSIHECSQHFRVIHWGLGNQSRSCVSSRGNLGLQLCTWTDLAEVSQLQAVTVITCSFINANFRCLANTVGTSGNSLYFLLSYSWLLMTLTSSTYDHLGIMGRGLWEWWW